MDTDVSQGFFQRQYKVILFYVTFAIIQFFFFFGLCHLMPGERLYQRVARMKAGQTSAVVITNPVKKSAVPNFETEEWHTQQARDQLHRAGHQTQSQPSE